MLSVLEFEEGEWEQINALAIRAGQTPGQWIRKQILAYLAYRNAGTAVYPETVRAALKVAGVDPTGSDDTHNPVDPTEKNGTSGDVWLFPFP